MANTGIELQELLIIFIVLLFVGLCLFAYMYQYYTNAVRNTRQRSGTEYDSDIESVSTHSSGESIIEERDPNFGWENEYNR